MADGLSFRPDKFSGGQDIEIRSNIIFLGDPSSPNSPVAKESFREMAIVVTPSGTPPYLLSGRRRKSTFVMSAGEINLSVEATEIGNRSEH